MKVVVLIAFFFHFTIAVFAQKGKIIYVVPDSVEILAVDSGSFFHPHSGPLFHPYSGASFHPSAKMELSFSS